MRAYQNILWLIAGIYIFMTWLFLLISYVVLDSQSLVPMIAIAAIIVVSLLPIYLWLRNPLFKVKKLHEDNKFKEIIDYMKQKPFIVFEQDLENIILFLAIAHWSINEEDQFRNYINQIKSPKLFALRDMWIIIDFLVNHQIFMAEEYHKTLVAHAYTAKPITLRKVLPEHVKMFIDLAKNKSNKQTYLEIVKQAKNPRIVNYLKEFEEDFM